MRFASYCAKCARVCSNQQAARFLQPRRRKSYSTDATSTAIEVTDPLLLYENLIRSGRVQWDEEQVRILVQLKRIHQSLVDYQPSHSLRYLLETPSRENTSSTLNDSSTAFVLPSLRSEKSLVRALSHEDDLSTIDSPVGFMLTGSVGTGKTLLLDLFYKSLPVSKQRIHYHAFLLGLYRKVFLALEQQRLHLDEEDMSLQKLAGQSGKGYQWSRQEENKAKALTKGWRQVFAGGRPSDDPTLVKEFVLAKIALDLIKDATVLAFDEVQLVDIAGAGILRRVLTWYWRLGGVVLATSNRLPTDLYQQGVQQEQFQSFLDQFQQRCPVYELRSDNDWRRRSRFSESSLLEPHEDGVPAWISSFNEKSTWFLDTVAFAQCFEGIVKLMGDGHSNVLTIYGRKVNVPWQIEGKAARFSFSDLCEKALGPADFLTITSSYPTIIIDQIPQLKLTAKNEARRFITFLDAAYESKTRLICLAAASPDKIFFPDAEQVLASEDNPLTADMLGEVMQDLEAPFRPNVSEYQDGNLPARVEEVMEDLRTASPVFRNLAIFTGQDEQFAYKRALSRIFEITSVEFVKTARHTPIPFEGRVWEHSKPIPQQQVQSSPPRQVEETEVLIPRGTKIDPLDPDLNVNQLYKPKIATTHFWGIVDSWGKRAGAWGQGVKVKREDIQKAEKEYRAEVMQRELEKAANPRQP